MYHAVPDVIQMWLAIFSASDGQVYQKQDMRERTSTQRGTSVTMHVAAELISEQLNTIMASQERVVERLLMQKTTVPRRQADSSLLPPGTAGHA